MAKKYEKITNTVELPVSFNPKTAFPLDARTMFGSYDDAVLAAQSAKEAGSSESVYYYGQTLVVFENDIAKFYIIQGDNTLQEIGNTDVNKDLKVDGKTSLASLTVNDNLIMVQGQNEAMTGIIADNGLKKAVLKAGTELIFNDFTSALRQYLMVNSLWLAFNVVLRLYAKGFICVVLTGVQFITCAIAPTLHKIPTKNKRICFFIRVDFRG
jgi:hypothetical protein